MTHNAIEDIFGLFKAEGKLVSARPFGSGHINDTYRVATDTGHNYLLQKINHVVFRDVAGLMDNIVHVIGHLKAKLADVPGASPDKEVLTLVPASNNMYFVKDADGGYWRVFVFLNNTKSYDQVLTEKQAFEGGKAFGRFQSLLSDLDPMLLIDTIPDFHNIKSRLEQLDKAVSADTAHRFNKVLSELEFIDERREQAMAVLQAGRQGLLPERIIHYDTKFNNVLLDERDHAQCVIDLDTIMPGYVAYDFGDAIRTIINNAAEDEAELKLINLNIPLFTAYTKGYLQQANGFLTENEVSSLIDGVLLLPYMQGVRFLTDYLNGDTYYKIHSPWHNLQRTKAQLQLLKKLEEAKDQLNNIIFKYWQHDKK